MSKNYFTKYLPVEGEIKEGDLLEKFFAGERFINIAGPDKKSHNGGKKVKLFLCTRDIQTGDSFYHSDIDRYFDCIGIKEDGSPQFYGSVGNINSFPMSDYLMKVIGEISPGAVWVTEGIELEADQVDEGFYYPYDPTKDLFSMPSELHWFRWDDKEAIEQEKKAGNLFCVRIKCPMCKTFH